jgi:hypothetical protein
MGMTPTRLKTPKELHARRMAFELDFEWYPDHDHAYVTTKSFTEQLGITTASYAAQICARS